MLKPVSSKYPREGGAYFGRGTVLMVHSGVAAAVAGPTFTTQIKITGHGILMGKNILAARSNR